MTAEPEVLEMGAHGRSYKLIDPGGNVGKKIRRAGRPYEFWLLEDMHARRLRGVAVDVGAHHGNHTLWLAAVCDLTVWAFEPSGCYSRLLENVALNGLTTVRTVNVALGAAEGTAAYAGRGRYVGPVLEMPPRGFSGAPEAVPGVEPVIVHPLDRYELQDVAVIKIDVEGAEPDVLRGAAETIGRCRPVIYAEAGNEPERRRALAAAFAPLGYRRTRRFKRGTPVERWDPVRA